MHAQGMGRGSGQVRGPALASSSHMISSSGPGSNPASVPGTGLMSLGSLPSLSPQRPARLPTPASGLGNLRNAEASRIRANFAQHYLRTYLIVYIYIVYYHALESVTVCSILLLIEVA